MFLRSILVAALVSGLFLAPVASALEDTPETRLAAVDKYLTILPLREMMREMTDEIAKQVPEAQRAHFFDVMNNKINIEKIEATARESLAKHLTLAEINHLVAYVEVPEGRSAMSKMKYYMGDVMPVMQGEIRRVLSENPPPSASEK